MKEEDEEYCWMNGEEEDYCVMKEEEEGYCRIKEGKCGSGETPVFCIKNKHLVTLRSLDGVLYIPAGT